MTLPSSSALPNFALFCVVILVAVNMNDGLWAAPQELDSPAISIPDGTVVHLYLMEDLNSKTAKKGDEVRFKVRESVQLNGVDVIAADSLVIGHVVDVGRNGFVGHSGKLGLSIDSASALNGAKIPLRGEGLLKGGSNGAVTAAATVYWGPGALLMRGWNAEIHRGTLLNAYVNGDQTITLNATASSSKMAAPSDSPYLGNIQEPRTAPGRGVLGVSGANWTEGEVTGVEILAIEHGSPADLTGLHIHNVITHVNGRRVRSNADLASALAKQAPGSKIVLGYIFKSNLGWMSTDTLVTLADK